MDQTDIDERHARADAIVKKNSRPTPRCISCGFTIEVWQPLLETIHGPYHGAPMTCVEGRD